MKPLLAFAHAVDRVSERFGQLAAWLVLAACVISAANAGVRYLFDRSSNAWLEVQWYMFAGMFLLAAAVTLKVNEHVRVDVVYGGRGPRTKAWIDLLGLVFFLLPFCAAVLMGSWGFFVDAWRTGETSPNAGGLVRWPVKLLMPLGFALLALQGTAEIIKRIGFLSGRHAMDTTYEKPLQ